ncbi:Nha1 protein [Martiniozyma asiatica (nom. inval.)]|nr:Nha1 protein [Martiniozyma asiatica]
MVWEHLSPDKAHVAYAVIAVFSALFSLCSLFVKEKLYLGEASAATIYGLIVGPHCLNWFNPISWGNYMYLTLEISRVLLCIEIVAVAVELPKKYVWKHWFSLFLMLIPGMVAGWLIIGSFIYILIPGCHFTWGLLISACITATDPVLAQAVVGKGKFAKRVPAHLRNLLSAESGCNDGVSVPFVYLSLNLIMHAGNANEIAKDWICVTVLYECGLGVLLGCSIGYCGRVLLKLSHRYNLIDYESSLAFYIMIALLCAGFGSILGVDDLLASFAAGTTFNWDGSATEHSEESPVSTVIDILLNMAFFVYFGSIIPWQEFNDSSLGLDVWRLIILSIVVIFLRRIPAVLVMKCLNPDIKDWKEALFVGHFGPIGVGAVFAAILALGDLEAWVLHEHEGPTTTYPLDNSYAQLIQIIWPVVCFLIVTSIIVHGSSVAVLTLGRHLQTMTFTYTYTVQKSETDNVKWFNRIPKLERSGTSFSLKRIDTMSTARDEEENQEENNFEKVHRLDAADNAAHNAQLGLPDLSNMPAVETSGVPVHPAGGAKRLKNKKKLMKKMRGKKKTSRARPQPETLDLRISRHNTEFSGRVSDNDELTKFNDNHSGEKQSDEATQTPSSAEQKEVNLAPADEASIQSEHTFETVPHIKATEAVLQSLSENYQLKPEDLEPEIDNDGQVRIPTKGYDYSNRLVIEDQHGEVLRTVRSRSPPSGDDSRRSHAASFTHSIASSLRLNPGIPQPIALDRAPSNDEDLEICVPSRSDTGFTLKKRLTALKDIGKKLQPSDERVEAGLSALLGSRKHANTISADKHVRQKLHGYRVGDNIILEDSNGEIVGRYKVNKKRDKDFSVGDLEKQSGEFETEQDLGEKLEDKLVHFIHSDPKNAIVHFPKKLTRNFRHGSESLQINDDSEYDSDDESDFDESDDGDNYNDGDINVNNTHRNRYHGSSSGEPVRGVIRAETKYERERRLGALNQSNRLSDDEEEEPKDKY